MSVVFVFLRYYDDGEVADTADPSFGDGNE